ncbi:IclR family transcriptional regulator [Parasphingorhabdus sp.]|uniref:IclR family transcriptional regulator n=1 Tax=Parasphingorhabdus sp. TaxID=2709688 RepID=UPI003264A7F6
MSRRGKPPSASEGERRGIQSVEVSTKILLALAGAGTAVPLRDLSQLTDMPSSKTHRYLSSFIRTGFVRQDPKTGRYDLGPAALKLGLAALSRFDVIDVAHDAMRELTAELGYTSLLSVWGPQGPTIVRWHRSADSLVTSLMLGSVFPLLSSATGRAFLPFLPDGLTSALITKELAANKRMVGQTHLPVKKADVQQLKNEVCDGGFATIDSTFIPGLCAIAAPILDSQGEAQAVITLIGAEHLPLLEDEATKKALAETCRSISLSE